MNWVSGSFAMAELSRYGRQWSFVMATERVYAARGARDRARGARLSKLAVRSRTRHELSRGDAAGIVGDPEGPWTGLSKYGYRRVWRDRGRAEHSTSSHGVFAAAEFHFHNPSRCDVGSDVGSPDG